MKGFKRLVYLTACSVIALTAGCALAFSCGCDLSSFLFDSDTVKHNRVNVSTIEEMKSVGKDDIAVLTQDIDCDFAVLPKVSSPYGVDGNGHTVRNFILNGNPLFGCRSIMNITLDNVIYKAENASAAAIVAQGGEDDIFEIENVHVKNSKMNVSAGNSSAYVGVFLGSGFTPNNPNGTGITLKNCTIDNVSVNCSGSGDKWISQLYAGGFVGYSKNIDISGCSANNCNFEIEAKRSSDCAVGGIIGYNYPKGTIKNCGYNDSYIRIVAYHYTTVLGAISKATTVYAGGIAGYYSAEGGMSCCYAKKADISAFSFGGVNAGGLIGCVSGKSQDFISHDLHTKISECYAVEGSVGTAYTDPKSSPHYIGGLVGLADNATFISSFACGYGIKLDMNDSYDYSCVGGFIGKSNSNVINYCATGMNEIIFESGNGQPLKETVDDFASGGTASYCYVTRPVSYGNRLNAESLTESAWYTPATIMDKLNLISPDWEFETGKLPYFGA